MTVEDLDVAMVVVFALLWIVSLVVGIRLVRRRGRRRPDGGEPPGSSARPG